MIFMVRKIPHFYLFDNLTRKLNDNQHQTRPKQLPLNAHQRKRLHVIIASNNGQIQCIKCDNSIYECASKRDHDLKGRFRSVLPISNIRNGFYLKSVAKIHQFHDIIQSAMLLPNKLDKFDCIRFTLLKIGCCFRQKSMF